MKIVQYEPEKKARIISDALVVLLSGGTIVYPTETAYALGADFFSPHAYRNIFDIKLRNPSKVLPVIVPDLRYATTLVKFSPKMTELAAKYWPGPLTLVLPFLYRDQWPHHRDDYLALRVSSHPFALSLSHAFGHPLISTSANISGTHPPYDADEIVEQLQKARRSPDLIINAGPLPKVLPSTVIKEDHSSFQILRQGSIRLPRF